MLKNIFKASVIVFFVSGCSVFMPVNTPQIHTYQLTVIDRTNSEASQCSNSTSNTVLQVTQVRADAPYDTLNMYYSNADYELGSYKVHQWVSLPSDMLTQSIQQKIIQSCTYANVVNADFMTVSKYRLTNQLVSWKQVINGKDSSFNMKIISQLVDNKTNQVEKSKTFDINVPVTPDPNGYITGANKATDQFLNQLLVWLKS